MNMNSLNHTPGGTKLNFGGHASIQPDSQGYLGYAAPRITIEGIKEKSGLGHLFNNEHPKLTLYHTSGNLGLSKLFNGIVIFPANGFNKKMRLSISGARMK